MLANRPSPFTTIRHHTLGLHTGQTVRRPALAHNLRAEVASLAVSRNDAGHDHSLVPRTYLDSTASSLKIGPVRRAETLAERMHANTHSQNFAAARQATRFYGSSDCCIEMDC